MWVPRERFQDALVLADQDAERGAVEERACGGQTEHVERGAEEERQGSGRTERMGASWGKNAGIPADRV